MDDGGRSKAVRKCRLGSLGLALLIGSGVQAQPLAPHPAYQPVLVHDPASCARPALWVVSDADTIIYLFGTIHTHDGQAHWFDHAVRRASDASDSLVLETVAPAQLPIIRITSGGLAAARATISSARQIGLSVDLGADRVLQLAADASGKPVLGLEDFADQLRMYQALPPAPPGPAVNSSAPDLTLAPFLRTLVDGWNWGENASIEQVMGAVRIQSPGAYRRLFSECNAVWASLIGTRLEQPGTVFLVVGSGHLVGADSVQSMILSRGIRSARIS